MAPKSSMNHMPHSHAATAPNAIGIRLVASITAHPWEGASKRTSWAGMGLREAAWVGCP